MEPLTCRKAWYRIKGSDQYHTIPPSAEILVEDLNSQLTVAHVVQPEAGKPVRKHRKKQEQISAKAMELMTHPPPSESISNLRSQLASLIDNPDNTRED